MIKTLILIAIVVLTTSLGIFLSANKKKRMQVFGDLYEFNEQLILNLKFSRQPISKIAEKYKFVPEILRGQKILEGEDGEIVSDYAINLGKTDALSQIDYLNGRKAALEKYKTESAAQYKKYSSLYVKIFFLVGVLIAVLIA